MAGSRNPINANYSLHGHVLETVTCARYLWVDISSGLSWRSHIDRVTGSATKKPNFVRRNVKIKHPGVREMAYSTLVFLSINTESINFDQYLRCGGWLNFEFSKREKHSGLAIKTIYKKLNRGMLKHMPLNQ